MGLRSICKLLIALVFVLLIGVSYQAASEASTDGPRFSGRSLAEALRELRADGLRILFSNELVRPDMRVEHEPEGGSPRELLEQLLLPHGLGVEAASGGLLTVVRLPSSPTLTVNVRHRDTEQPVADAQVILVAAGAVDSGQVVLTDAAGELEIPELEPGAYTLEVRRPGFVVERLESVVVGARGARVTVRLIPAPISREDIVVVTPSYYALLRAQPEARQFLTRDEVHRLPHLADDPFRAVSWLPGTATSDLSVELHVRGGDQDEVQVLLDGLEIFHPFHFRDASIVGVIDAEAIASVDFMTGGFPARYGNSMSGIIDLASRLPSDRRRFSLGLSLTNVRLQGSDRLGGAGGDWLLSARRGFLGPLLALAGEAEDDENLSPRFVDVLAKVRMPLSRRQMLSASAFIARDDFSSGDEIDQINLEHTSGYAWLDLSSAWSSRLFSRAQVVASRLERERDEHDVIRGPPLEVRDRRSVDSLGLEQLWGYRLNDRHELKWGLGFRHARARYDYASSALVTFPFRADLFAGFSDAVWIRRDLAGRPAGDERSAFLSDTMHLDSEMTIELGLRWDEQTYTGDGAQWSPRVNLSRGLGRHGTLRLGWGFFYQSQRLHELQVGDGVERFYPAQFAEHRIVGYEHRFARREPVAGRRLGRAWHALIDGLELRAEIYQKLISDLRPRFENLFDPTELFAEAAPDRVRIAPTRARAEGIELLVKQGGRAKLGWWLSYALARAEDEVDQRWVPRSWDQRHTLRASLSYRLGSRWSLNLASLYHTGWPTTAVSIVVERRDETLKVRPVLGPRNAERLPDFFRVDLRVSRHLELKKRGSLGFFLELINLTDHKNVCCLVQPQLVFTDDGFAVEHRQGSVSFVPSFGISWEL